MSKEDEEITHKKSIKEFNIIFVGDEYVGKTSVIDRSINKFDSETNNRTIGIDLVKKNINVGSKMLRLKLWDTAGYVRLRSLIPNYAKKCQVALIIYDITSEESYEGITQWIDFMKEYRGDDLMIVVVGNKIDLEKDRKIDCNIANEKFTEVGIKYYEVSARTGEKVEEMLEEICGELAERGCEETVIKSAIKLTNVNQDERRRRQKDCC